MSHQNRVQQSPASLSYSCRHCGRDKVAVLKWGLLELMLSGKRQVPEEWLQGANPVRLLKGLQTDHDWTCAHFRHQFKRLCMKSGNL